VDITDDNLRARARARAAGQRIVITAGEEGIWGGSPPADVKITSAGDATPMEQQPSVSPLYRPPRRKIILLLCLPTITSGRTRYLYDDKRLQKNAVSAAYKSTLRA